MKASSLLPEPHTALQASATESRGPAQIFTGGDFNLSTTSATFTPDPSANGGYDVCTSSFSLFNTTAALQVTLNNTDFTVFNLSAPRSGNLHPGFLSLCSTSQYNLTCKQSFVRKQADFH